MCRTGYVCWCCVWLVYLGGSFFVWLFTLREVRQVSQSLSAVLHLHGGGVCCALCGGWPACQASRRRAGRVCGCRASGCVLLLGGGVVSPVAACCGAAPLPVWVGRVDVCPVGSACVRCSRPCGGCDCGGGCGAPGALVAGPLGGREDLPAPRPADHCSTVCHCCRFCVPAAWCGWLAMCSSFSGLACCAFLRSASSATASPAASCVSFTMAACRATRSSPVIAVSVVRKSWSLAPSSAGVAGESRGGWLRAVVAVMTAYFCVALHSRAEGRGAGGCPVCRLMRCAAR